GCRGAVHRCGRGGGPRGGKTVGVAFHHDGRPGIPRASEAAWDFAPLACRLRATVSSRLGAGPLAAAIAASCDDTAATLGGHAGTEAVPAFADEFGRLVGTLHLF